MNDQILEVLPDLGRDTLSLTRDQADADDLVQDCVEHTLVKADLFRPGTNLRAG